MQKISCSAYLALIRSTLEHRSTVWDPNYQGIDRLERVQRQAAREEDCVTKMLSDLKLPSLLDRIWRWITSFTNYKVVEGLVPTFPCPDFVTPERPKCVLSLSNITTLFLFLPLIFPSSSSNNVQGPLWSIVVHGDFTRSWWGTIRCRLKIKLCTVNWCLLLRQASLEALHGGCCGYVLW